MGTDILREYLPSFKDGICTCDELYHKITTDEGN